MKIVVAAIQMPSDPLDVAANLHRADRASPRGPAAGVELAVLPELFNTGYSLLPDYGPFSETADGPTLTHLRAAKPAVEDGDRRGLRRALRAGTSTTRSSSARPTATSAFIASVTWCSGSGSASSPADEPLVVSTPWGRIGFAICADMIYRKVWHDYRGRIDLAVVSAAWPDFADRDTGGGTGCSATSARSPGRSRGRSRATWASR